MGEGPTGRGRAPSPVSTLYVNAGGKSYPQEQAGTPFFSRISSIPTGGKIPAQRSTSGISCSAPSKQCTHKKTRPGRTRVPDAGPTIDKKSVYGDKSRVFREYASCLWIRSGIVRVSSAMTASCHSSRQEQSRPSNSAVSKWEL